MIGGASGDMLLGALIDVGLSIDDLRSELALMDIGGYTLRSEQVSRGALNCTLLHVDLDEEGQRRRGWDELSGTIESSRLPEEVRIKSIEVLDRLTDAESVVHGVDRHHLTPHELGTIDTLVDIVGVIAGFRLLGIEQISAHQMLLPCADIGMFLAARVLGYVKQRNCDQHGNTYKGEPRKF